LSFCILKNFIKPWGFDNTVCVYRVSTSSGLREHPEPNEALSPWMRAFLDVKGLIDPMGEETIRA
jgi:hypothetical protein